MTKEKLKTVISESTLIPISLLITILGGATFIGYIYFQTSANAKDISEFKASGVLEQIKSDTAVIKNDIQTMKEDIRQFTRRHK